MNFPGWLGPVGKIVGSIIDLIATRRRKKALRDEMDAIINEHDGGGHPVVFPLDEARRKLRAERSAKK